jgi:hypothetical protein
MSRRRVLMLSWAGGGINPLAYALMRDLFTDAQATLIDGNAQPGAGARDVTGALLENLSSALRGGSQISSPTWGSSKLVWTAIGGAGFDRTAGRTFCALITLEDFASDMVLGFDTATNITDPRALGHGWVNEGGAFHVATPGRKILVDGGTRNIRSMQYLVGVTLNTQGAVVWISTFGTDDFTAPAAGMSDLYGVPAYPLARILWVEDASTTTPLYPALSFYDSGNGSPAYPNAQCVQDARLVDVATWATDNALASFADRFTRANSATLLGNNWAVDNGTGGISSNAAYFPVIASGFGRAYQANALPLGGDGMVCCDITVPTTAGTGFGLMLRRQDANNFLRLWTNNTTNAIHLQTWVAGGFGASVASTGAGISWVAGATNRWVVFMKGANYRIFIDGVDPFGGSWQNDANSRFITARDCGLYCINATDFATIRWDNFAVFPFAVTLPSEITAGAVPVVYVPGSTLASDTFTDTNGTALASHTPTSGSAWTAHAGTWTIQSNRATCATGASVNQATQDVSSRNVECSVEVITPGAFPTGKIRSGIVVRRVDADNTLVARLYKDPSQVGSDEIELLETIGGVGAVCHKVNLGAYFAISTTYTLKVQIAADPNGGDDLLQVWLDGKPRVSYKISAANVGTRHGLHFDSVDDGCVFDAWTVKAL